MAFDKIKNAEEAAQELQRKEENKKKIKKRLDMVENVRKSNPIFTLVDQSESYPVKSNKDAVSRKSLLLSTVQMIHENYPLPVDTGKVILTNYFKCSVIWDTLIITIFMGSGWPMFSENALMLYQQDLQLGPYFVRWQC